MKSAISHIPDSMPSLRRAVGDSIEGLNCIMLDTECTTDEVRVLLTALHKGYKETESAGPSSLGDPNYFPSYMERFAELIHLIEEELEERDELRGNEPSGTP
jgi:hypothetical protein